MNQVIDSLDFLHNLQIVHRDLKPSNVFVVDKDKLHIKLADLGIALAAKDVDISCMSMTTIRAPETGADLALYVNFNVDDKNEYKKSSDVFYIGQVLEKLLEIVRNPVHPPPKTENAELKEIEEIHLMYLEEAIRRCKRDVGDQKEEDKKDPNVKRISLAVLIEIIDCVKDSFWNRVNACSPGSLREGMGPPPEAQEDQTPDEE